MEDFETKPTLAVLESKPWDPIELVLASAKDYGPFRPSNLRATDDFPLHAFFSRESWSSVSDEDYNILRPSMQFASNLVQVGMPYLCSFVPSSRAHDHLVDERANNKNSYQIDPQPWTEEDFQETRDALLEIANCVEWELNDTIAKDNKWLGITRLVTSEEWGPRPWKDLSRDDIMKSDIELMENGTFRRRLKVGIMQEYVDALKKYSNDSEEHLRATVLAAITMTHEVGHIVWHQDFRSMDYDRDGAEPYFADYSISELGCCFIASIFDGKNPFECGKQVPTDFTQALYWERVPKLDTDELYRTDYSMSIPYLEQILSQESWNQLDPTDPDFLIDALDMLHPEDDAPEEKFLPDGSPDISYGFGIALASANVREWTVSRYDGDVKVIWKSAFVDRRIRSDEKLQDVTEAEKELAMYEINLTSPGAFEDIDASSDSSHKWNILTSSLFDPTRLIHHGVIDLDLASTGRFVNLNTPTRIEIRYRPKPGDFREVHQACARRHRRRTGAMQGSNISEFDWFSNFDTDLPEYDSSVPKDFQFGGPREAYEPANVLDLIANKQPDIIAKTSIIDAHQFCIKRHINFGLPIPATYVEQNQKLDRTKAADRALIERIRQFCLGEAEKLFEGNNQALLYIFYAEIKYMDDWSEEDLLERCGVEGLDGSGNVRVLRQRVRDHLVKYLRNFAKHHNMSASDEVSKAVGLVDDVDLIAWTDSDWIGFFRINNLPTWGNRRIWIQRHADFEREQIYGFKGRHHKINFDSKGVIQRSIHGVETYVWDAALAGSSVQALKRALFEAGHFPSDSTLNLYFGKDRGTQLEDDKPLSYYEPADWKKLSLEITRTSQAEKPDTKMAETEPPVIFYKPKVPGIQYWHGEDRHDASSGSGSGSGSTVHLPKRSRIPKDVQRIYDLTHNKAQPTATELLDSIHTRAQELTQIQQPLGARDILRPHLKTVRSKSVLEMLDSFRDLQEVREERQRLIDMQVDPEEVTESDRRKRVRFWEEMGVDAVGADGGGVMMVNRQVAVGKKRVGSFMGNIFRELKGRV
ncbi:hypothetical protein DL98DRAFT_652516 [Cadophora sp. DSE1049]|nr:hypothetical protein DL98DRAFT_652516 [Cadophora sp. DSE1049]